LAENYQTPEAKLSVLAPLVGIFGVTSLLPLATEFFEGLLVML
jgi:hypothetical protein